MSEHKNGEQKCGGVRIDGERNLVERVDLFIEIH